MLPLDFFLRLMTDADARQVVEWRYDGLYSFYDMDQDPDDRREILDARSRGKAYFTVIDTAGTVVGFFSFRMAGASIDVSLGLRPDLTGRGNGLAFVLAGTAFAEGRFGRGCLLRLRVAAFNERAIKVYERAGFRVRSRFMQATNGGFQAFVEMTRDGR
ncbi:MAG: GNAT family N-acetyltransferase [Bacillota bacterium]